MSKNPIVFGYIPMSNLVCVYLGFSGFFGLSHFLPYCGSHFCLQLENEWTDQHEMFRVDAGMDEWEPYCFWVHSEEHSSLCILRVFELFGLSCRTSFLGVPYSGCSNSVCKLVCLSGTYWPVGGAVWSLLYLFYWKFTFVCGFLKIQLECVVGGWQVHTVSV